MPSQDMIYKINRVIKSYSAGEIFTCSQIAYKIAQEYAVRNPCAKSFVRLYLRHLVNTKQVQRINRSLYYRAELTAFGSTPPDYYQFAIKSFTQRQKERIGYESGASFLNKIGLSTLMPKAVQITTNNYHKRIAGATNIIVKRPVTKITNENWCYLQVIDMLCTLRVSHVDSDNPDLRIRTLIRDYNLDVAKLLKYTKRYYSKATLQEVQRLIDGGNIL